MYIKDGICYAGELSNPIEILKAVPIGDQTLKVWFSNGEYGVFDAEKLTGPVFAPLKNKEVFQNVTIEFGALSWADGTIDVAPEFVYQNSVIDNTPVNAVAEDAASFGQD